MPIYSVLFLDIKTFMAPAVLNSFKMQEETRAGTHGAIDIVVIGAGIGGITVQRDGFPFPDLLASEMAFMMGYVNFETGTIHDADLPHLPGNYRGV